MADSDEVGSSITTMGGFPANARATAIDIKPNAYLVNNDSYRFFEQVGDLLITGPTRTNVMDMQILLISG